MPLRIILVLCLLGTGILTAKEPQDWWAFQPLKTASPPTVQDTTWPRNAIDRYILAALEAKELKPGADADAATLRRRLSFDLTGLPPEGAPVDFGAAVEALLASPRFGECWGRHWLDVARYAESSGRDENVTFPNAWRYRDYVIASFNKDKPYDRFVQEQIAGDLLPSANQAERTQTLIATGFLAVGAKSLNETVPRQFAVDLADEQISAVSEAFLGLTVGCARCHDHKFDPISQRDYTALAGIFLSTDTRYGTPGGVQGRNLGTLLELPANLGLPIVATPMEAGEMARKTRNNQALREELRRILADRAPNNPSRLQSTGAMSAFDIVRIFTQSAQLDAELANFYEDGQPKTLAMGAVDRPAIAPARGGRQGPPNPGRGRRTSGFELIGDAPLFSRGDINQEKVTIPRALPALLGPAPSIPPASSGRLELAQWLTAPSNPLPARVIVNRVWAWLFGRGLVASMDNFGVTGEAPTHPELLDYLAGKLIRDGWSLKALIREIVTSRTYQLSSAIDPACLAADPENTLLWRHRSRRLEAEAIRDAMLAASGALQLQAPAGSTIGRAGDGPIGGPRNFALTEAEAARVDSDARSVYLGAARNVPPEVLAVFNFPDGAAVQGGREVTNVPTQALYMMNSDFVAQQSERLGAWLLAQPGGDEARFSQACERVFNRAPLPAELEAAQAFLSHAADEKAGWTSVARSLFCSAAFRTLD